MKVEYGLILIKIYIFRKDKFIKVKNYRICSI